MNSNEDDGLCPLDINRSPATTLLNLQTNSQLQHSQQSAAPIAKSNRQKVGAFRIFGQFEFPNGFHWNSAVDSQSD